MPPRSKFPSKSLAKNPQKAASTVQPQKSVEAVVQITDLSRSGTGVGRGEDGRVVFVPFSAPGDEVRVLITRQDKRFSQAELLEVLQPSQLRVMPPCPVFGKCGGCQWQHIPYLLQWDTKVKGVMTALSRVEISVTADRIDSIPAEQIWNYRNRIQLRGSGGASSVLGYYAAKSHEIVGIKTCPVARPEINAVLPQILEEGRKLDQPYKVEIEVLSDGSTRTSWNAAHAAAGFRQIHDEQNEKLKSWVASQLTLSRDRHVYDLFGGAGNLAKAISSKVYSVDCVDLSSPEGTTLEEFPNLKFHQSPVQKWLFKENRDQKYRSNFDSQSVNSNRSAQRSAILDPPREGLGDDHLKISESLESLGVNEIVAVGCDVDSWARDVSRFVKRGWRLERIGVLDLFPQTPHVESLALLRL